MRIIGLLCGAALALSGCVSTPRQPVPSQPVQVQPPDPVDQSLWQSLPRPVAYDSLPGWQTADLAPGLSALTRSCAVFSARSPQSLVSTRAPWAGRHDDWAPACAALDVIADAQSARAVMQALFTPVEIAAPDGQSRFTGFFEPTYQARLVPEAPYTEPVPGRPADLVTSAGNVYQMLPDGTRRAYPSRAEITRAGVRPLAYAHPGDVFFLQIQGSGRLILPDGRTLRAVYAANNGQPFRSTANWLMERGWISRGEASMRGIRAWMDRTTPQRAREAMNANPRFVFFDIEPEGDPRLGPKGSFGVPLTPLGSMAVDLDFHAGGVPMFVQTTAPALGGTWSGLVVSQDTGGAIKGAVRGDLYFGTGDAAGARADTVNAPGRMWVLLPRAVAERIRMSNAAEASGTGPVVLTP
ncbi:MAG: MltA domain-containing protein [Alphaproteobacteria bacterium]|nr:MltA domain-containing protein [Alphaproteobacteria bacterium]